MRQNQPSWQAAAWANSHHHVKTSLTDKGWQIHWRWGCCNLVGEKSNIGRRTLVIIAHCGPQQGRSGSWMSLASVLLILWWDIRHEMSCQLLSKSEKSEAEVNDLFKCYLYCVSTAGYERINLQFGSFSMVSGNFPLITMPIIDLAVGDK